MRQESFGQNRKFSLVDKLGIFLSEKAVKKQFKILKKDKIELLDLGCGFYARLLTRLASSISSGTGVDLNIDESVKKIPNLVFIEKTIEEVLPDFKDRKYDCILIISVLEHINDPLSVLKECFRILKDGGILLINVPTWLGKYFLEKSAFNYKLSPKNEMDDHKMYYNKKDLWPLLVKAGFKPSLIKLKYHKFGLNLFSICKNIRGD